MNAWLWPDHMIGKSESRVLREQHNALANSHTQLLEAFKTFANQMSDFLDRIDNFYVDALDADIQVARAAIKAAGG